MGRLNVKTILLFILSSFTVFAGNCPEGFDYCLDVGSAYMGNGASGFGMDPGKSDYGGHDGGSTIGVVWEPVDGICHENYENAYFLGSTNPVPWKKITIRYYDGPSNSDSFRVYITSDNLIGTINNKNDNTGTWETVEIQIPKHYAVGTTSVRIEAISPMSEDCGETGQVAINWIGINEEPEQIPEFSQITAIIALIGAVLTIISLRIN